jgi:hypothetical protein
MAEEQKKEGEQKDANDSGQKSEHKEQPKTFTQEQLDAILGERLQREREKTKDYEELKKFKETQEAASKTEAEKLTERATKAEAEATRIKGESAQRLLLSEARAVAAELGFTKPDIAVKAADLSKAVKDGEIDAAAIKTALEALAKDYPGMVGKTVPNPGATNPKKGSETSEKETDAQRLARLRGGGTVNDWLGGAQVTYHPKPDK